MEQEQSSYKKPSLFFSLSIAFFLLIGIVVSVIQVQKTQNTNSRAADLPLLNNCSVSATDLAIKPEEQKLLTDLNAYRAQNGAQPLRMNTTLKRAAQWLANDMNVKSYLSHTDSLGRPPTQRLTDCGLANNYSNTGENILREAAPGQALSMWKSSPPHNANMLSTKYTQVGIASSGNYWVQDFASDDPSGVIQVSPLPTPAANSGVIPTTASGGNDIGDDGDEADDNDPDATDPDSPDNPDDQNPTPEPEAPTVAPTKIPPLATNMRVTIAVKISGIGQGGNIFPKHLTRRVLVTLYGLDNEEVKKGTGFLTYDRHDLFTGTINFGKLYEGKYIIKIIGQEQVTPDTIKSVTLQATVLPLFQKLVATTNNPLPKVTLLQGDLDEDNKLTLNDYRLALVCFQTRGCTRDPALGETYDLIDFNDDGNVNAVDYNVLLRNFFEQKGDD